MWIILVVVYLSVGGALCFLFNMVDDGYFIDCLSDDYGTTVSVLTGIFWPVVAPFSFAILYARKKKDNG